MLTITRFWHCPTQASLPVSHIWHHTSEITDVHCQMNFPASKILRPDRCSYEWCMKTCPMLPSDDWTSILCQQEKETPAVHWTKSDKEERHSCMRLKAKVSFWKMRSVCSFLPMSLWHLRYSYSSSSTRSTPGFRENRKVSLEQGPTWLEDDSTVDEWCCQRNFL